MSAARDTSHLRVALHARTPEDAQRLGRALRRLMANDPALAVHGPDDSGDVLIAGEHERHLELILDRLKRDFDMQVEVGRPQVAYRGAFTRPAEGEMKYARKAEGRGQYAHVKLRVHPREHGSGYLFENKVTGDAIPPRFMDAIDDAIRDALSEGVPAGFPVKDVGVEIQDGSYHDKDSSEEAFRTAASLAVMNAARQAGPVCLEPVMRVRAVVASEYVNDVITNLRERRGQLHLRRRVHGGELIVAHVPLGGAVRLRCGLSQ